MKKFLCLGMIVVLGLAFLACDSGNLQKQIDALNLQLIEQQKTIDRLLKVKIDFKKKVEQIETENRRLKSRFYPLKQGYINGILTKEDVKSISYNLTGKVIEVVDYKDELWKNEVWELENRWTVIKRLDFTPTTEKPELATMVENDIKNAYFLKNPALFKRADDTEIYGGPDDMDVAYLGNYKGFYAVVLSSPLWDHESDAKEMSIADIVFTNQIYALENILLFNYL